jgi:DNA (cytosine-5)-methyltransferase 1
VTFGSLFAGVGGFDRGLELAGMTSQFQVEIDAFCRRVLARHWPHVTRHSDVRDVCRNLIRAGDGRCAECGRVGWLPWVDVLCGGFPCQDVSIAGKRKGLKGDRTGLFYQFTRIAAEMRPTWVLLENVDGLLSTHCGEDFGLVLRELEDVGYVAGAWRVLDSRWFGVPQRRNRVFIVGCLGGSGRRPESVLFESARGGWDSPPRRQAETRVAATLRGRSHRPGVNAPGRSGEDDLNVVAHALCSSKTRTGRLDPNGETFIASALTASMGHRGHGSPRGDANDNLVVGALGQNKDRGGWRCGPDEVAAGHALAVYALGSHAGAADGEQTNKSHAAGGPVGMGIQADMAHTLRSGRPGRIGGQQSGVRRLTPLECERLQAFPDGHTCICGAADEYRKVLFVVWCTALREGLQEREARGALHVSEEAVLQLSLRSAASSRTRGGDSGFWEEARAAALSAAALPDMWPERAASPQGREHAEQCPREHRLPVCLVSRQRTLGDGDASQSSGEAMYQGSRQPWADHRLRGLTALCTCKDGPRYKALGNAVTVTVIEWIGRRLMAAEAAWREEATA